VDAASIDRGRPFAQSRRPRSRRNAIPAFRKCVGCFEILDGLAVGAHREAFFDKAGRFTVGTGSSYVDCSVFLVMRVAICYLCTDRLKGIRGFVVSNTSETNATEEGDEPKCCWDYCWERCFGAIDGATAWFIRRCAPSSRALSSGYRKGLIAGVAAGIFCSKGEFPVPLGILFACGCFVLAFLVAYMQHGYYFARSSLPGSIVGMIVGYARKSTERLRQQRRRRDRARLRKEQTSLF